MAAGQAAVKPWEAWLVRILGAALMVLAVASVVTMTVYVQRQGELVRCQTTYNEAFREASLQLRNASQAERDAQRKLLTTPATTVAERQQALRTYLDTLAAADEVRAEHPLPTTPCG